MKPSLFYVSLILFINTIGIAYAIQNEVIDSSGNKVLNNVPYHIGPFTADKGGGFKLTDTMDNKQICPLDVVQEPDGSNLGDKFTFTLTDDKKPPYLQTTHSIGIDSGPPKDPCEKSTVWKIPNAEGKAPNNLVTTGGVFKEGGSCFKLLEHRKPTTEEKHSYILQHCPYRCGVAPDTCYNVSMYEDNGVRRLASKGPEPFEFVFHKADN